MTLKQGVRLAGLQPQMLVALMVVSEVFDDVCADTVVTSCNDSQHSRGSLHFKGLAFDFRTKHVMAAQVPTLIRRIKAALGDEYDVVLENFTGDDNARDLNEHLHVEWDPKG